MELGDLSREEYKASGSPSSPSSNTEYTAKGSIDVFTDFCVLYKQVFLLFTQ